MDAESAIRSAHEAVRQAAAQAADGVLLRRASQAAVGVHGSRTRSAEGRAHHEGLHSARIVRVLLLLMTSTTAVTFGFCAEAKLKRGR